MRFESIIMLIIAVAFFIDGCSPFGTGPTLSRSYPVKVKDSRDAYTAVVRECIEPRLKSGGSPFELANCEASHGYASVIISVSPSDMQEREQRLTSDWKECDERAKKASDPFIFVECMRGKRYVVVSPAR